MIGKAEWFTRRKYGGWGLTPRTWQGWVYIAAWFIPFMAFQSLGFWDTATRFIVTGVWLGLLVLDVLNIMMHLKKDEREKIHEAIAERNAAWAMVAVLVIGLLYEITTSALEQRFYANPTIVIALFAGLIAKSASNIYLDRTQ
ncbi:MAG: hypothetical protein ABH879_01290 [archaeon]